MDRRQFTALLAALLVLAHAGEDAEAEADTEPEGIPYPDRHFDGYLSAHLAGNKGERNAAVGVDVWGDGAWAVTVRSFRAGEAEVRLAGGGDDSAAALLADLGAALFGPRA